LGLSVVCPECGQSLYMIEEIRCPYIASDEKLTENVLVLGRKLSVDPVNIKFEWYEVLNVGLSEIFGFSLGL